MGLLNKKLSLQGLKGKLAGAASSVTETVQTVSGTTTSAARVAFDATRAKAVSTSEEIRNFNYSELKKKEYYKHKFVTYKSLSSARISEMYRTTFEVDKSTLEMIDDVRSRLPVPAATMDDIFEQCRREAMRRAIASFALGGVMQEIDAHSAAKYSNLSESYTTFRTRAGNAMTDDPHFAAMKDTRYEARAEWSLLENGYNRADPLDPYSADIEHVVAKKAFYDDLLIRMGTTDEAFYSLINAPDNLVFADASLNRSMKAADVNTYLQNNGRVDPLDPALIHVDITQKDGQIKTVTVNKNDVQEALDRAHAHQQHHRLEAAKEVGVTMAKTGATMTAQQVVGLIVLETVDIFIDEIKGLSQEGRMINSDGWVKNAQQMSERIKTRLTARVEERQIWARARALGIESGISGALSVIPQILIALIVKMPAFVLALIRECTLSTVRCVRVLASKEPDKLANIKVILAGAAAGIVGLYVARVIGNAIATVPLLNKFNHQITDVLTGLVVTAVPLTAIYTFEQNKNRLLFTLGNLRRTGAVRQSDAAVE
ncbi:hypothetical protein [Siccibacter turicensis]|uniref:hypothetical protein n=1 Tax=Siccibacter turicensis TaxID=357233 RepID=UPI003F563A86